MSDDACGNIFSKDSRPLSFYMLPCKHKKTVAKLVKGHGGEMADNRKEADFQLYNPSDIVSDPSYVSRIFVEDCVAQGKLLDVELYRYPARKKLENELANKKRQPHQVPDFVFKDKDAPQTSLTNRPANRPAAVTRSAKYTVDEDMAIIRAVIKDSKYHSVNGNKIWENLERRQVTLRSSLSMKERFHKKILPFAVNYDLTEAEIRQITSLFSAKSATVEKALNPPLLLAPVISDPYDLSRESLPTIRTRGARCLQEPPLAELSPNKAKKTGASKEQSDSQVIQNSPEETTATRFRRLRRKLESSDSDSDLELLYPTPRNLSLKVIPTTKVHKRSSLQAMERHGHGDGPSAKERKGIGECGGQLLPSEILIEDDDTDSELEISIYSPTKVRSLQKRHQDAPTQSVQTTFETKQQSLLGTLAKPMASGAEAITGTCIEPVTATDSEAIKEIHTETSAASQAVDVSLTDVLAVISTTNMASGPEPESSDTAHPTSQNVNLGNGDCSTLPIPNSASSSSDLLQPKHTQTTPADKSPKDKSSKEVNRLSTESQIIHSLTLSTSVTTTTRTCSSLTQFPTTIPTSTQLPDSNDIFEARIMSDEVLDDKEVWPSPVISPCVETNAAKSQQTWSTLELNSEQLQQLSGGLTDKINETRDDEPTSPIIHRRPIHLVPSAEKAVTHTDTLPSAPLSSDIPVDAGKDLSTVNSTPALPKNPSQSFESVTYVPQSWSSHTAEDIVECSWQTPDTDNSLSHLSPRLPTTPKRESGLKHVLSRRTKGESSHHKQKSSNLPFTMLYKSRISMPYQECPSRLDSDTDTSFRSAKSNLSPSADSENVGCTVEDDTCAVKRRRTKTNHNDISSVPELQPHPPASTSNAAALTDSIQCETTSVVKSEPLSRTENTNNSALLRTDPVPSSVRAAFLSADGPIPLCDQCAAKTNIPVRHRCHIAEIQNKEQYIRIKETHEMEDSVLLKLVCDLSEDWDIIEQHIITNGEIGEKWTPYDDKLLTYAYHRKRHIKRLRLKFSGREIKYRRAYLLRRVGISVEQRRVLLNMID